MGLLNFKTKRLRIPEGHKYKDCLIDEDEDSLLMIFEKKKNRRGSK
jgi:hypothetical protein